MIAPSRHREVLHMVAHNPYLRAKVVVPAVMLFLVVGYLIMAIDMGTFFIGEKTGEAFFPLILGIIGVPLATWILYDAVAEVRKVAKQGADQEDAGQSAHKRRTTPLILTVVSFVYIALFHYIGLIPALLIYVFLFMTFFDDKIQHLPRKLLYSVAITAVIYVLYSLIFKVQFDKILFGLIM